MCRNVKVISVPEAFETVDFATIDFFVRNCELLVVSEIRLNSKNQTSTMTDVVTKLTNYFHMFDGTSKSLEEEQSVIDQVIDHHAIFQSPNCDTAYSYPEYLEHVRQRLEDGCKADILELKMHEKGVEYNVRLTSPGKDSIVIRSVGVVDNGKIVRVEPVDNTEA